MSQSEKFYTLKGYQLNETSELTYAMEDYLEMLCRLTREHTPVRLSELAEKLNVRPSSASKMVGQLKLVGFVQAEKYGDLLLTEKGREAGNYLLYRHDVLNRFFRALNRSEDELEQVEKVEHFIGRGTIENLAALTVRLESENV